jgi:outer membrane receptor for ferrienterochelin and colicins
MRAPAVLSLACLLTGPCSEAASAQQAAVGSVYEEDSGTSIGGASIGWRPNGEGVVRWVNADLRGRFDVPRDWVGSGSIEVRALGHRTRVLDVAEAAGMGWRIPLEADPLELESVVVTARGRAQRRADVAVPIARISAQEILIASATSAEALLAEIPGLQAMSRPPVGSNIMIRGIGDSRVLVLVDGQPSGGALLENRDLSRMSLAGVERVEVVKGPLSSQYGSDALGGVINVVTRAPEPGLRGDARFLAAGAGRKEADATLSGGGDLLYRVTGSWRQEDQVPGLDRSLDVFARVWDLRATARYEGGRRVRVRSDATFVRERQRWPVGGGFSGFHDNRGITGWTEATVDHGPGAWLLRGFGQDYEHLYRSAQGNAPIAGSAERQEERVWKATLGYSLPLGAHEVDVGAEGSRRSITSPDKLLEDRAEDGQLELFVQDAWTWRRATITGGGRATFNDRWGNTFSPTFGLAVLFRDDLLARATVGRGFRAPSFKELAWDFANVGAGYRIQGFADLEPEHSWSGSAGVDWAPSSALRLTLEAYHNEIYDLIESAFVGNDPSGLLIYSPRNVSRARTRGLEAGASVRLGRARVEADYAFLDARSVDDHVALDRRARHSGRLRLGGDLDVWRGMAIDVTTHVTGDAPLIGSNAQGQPAQVGRQDALLRVDAQMTLDMPMGFRAVFGVDNLLDTRADGWEAVIARRFRAGIEAHDLF